MKKGPREGALLLSRSPSLDGRVLWYPSFWHGFWNGSKFLAPGSPYEPQADEAKGKAETCEEGGNTKSELEC